MRREEVAPAALASVLHATKLGEIIETQAIGLRSAIRCAHTPAEAPFRPLLHAHHPTHETANDGGP